MSDPDDEQGTANMLVPICSEEQSVLDELNLMLGQGMECGFETLDKEQVT